MKGNSLCWAADLQKWKGQDDVSIIFNIQNLIETFKEGKWTKLRLGVK